MNIESALISSCYVLTADIFSVLAQLYRHVDGELSKLCDPVVLARFAVRCLVPVLSFDSIP